MSHWSVCLCVSHAAEVLGKNGWTDRDAVLIANSSGSHRNLVINRVRINWVPIVANHRLRGLSTGLISIPVTLIDGVWNLSMVRRLRTDLLRIEWYVKPSFNLYQSVTYGAALHRAVPHDTASRRISTHSHGCATVISVPWRPYFTIPTPTPRVGRLPRSACHKNNFVKSRLSDVSARILVTKSVHVGVVECGLYAAQYRS